MVYIEGVIALLKLASFSRDDFQQLMDWIPNATFAMQWSGPSFTYPLTTEQLENYIRGANEPNASTYVFKVIDEFTNEVIGHVSLGNVDRGNSSARIGKVLVGSANSRGKGYGTQLMNAVLTFAFEQLKLQKVTLVVFDFNTSAIQCYEKVGFKREGFIQGARKNGDEYWNLIEMGILYDEWINQVRK